MGPGPGQVPRSVCECGMEGFLAGQTPWFTLPTCAFSGDSCRMFSRPPETYSQQSAPPLFFPGLEEVLKPIQGASLLQDEGSMLTTVPMTLELLGLKPPWAAARAVLGSLGILSPAWLLRGRRPDFPTWVVCNPVVAQGRGMTVAEKETHPQYDQVPSVQPSERNLWSSQQSAGWGSQPWPPW